MINENKIKELLSKLDNYIDSAGSVSPTSEKSGGDYVTPDKFILTNETNVEKLSDNEVLLAHALLHQFYATGGIKDLDISDIERLHKKVKERMKDHSNFDKLDLIK